MNYPDRAGPAGSQLTAEVAQALPTRSADARTDTFKIRPGFRFSPPSNQPVTAQTFKATIERALNPSMHSPTAHYLADVVGARAYMAGRAGHIAGVVAHGDTLAIRLLAPDPDFVSRIAQPTFCAVPSDTPINPNGVRVIPSAGPYYVGPTPPARKSCWSATRTTTAIALTVRADHAGRRDLRPAGSRRSQGRHR